MILRLLLASLSAAITTAPAGVEQLWALERISLPGTSPRAWTSTAEHGSGSGRANRVTIVDYDGHALVVLAEGGFQTLASGLSERLEARNNTGSHYIYGSSGLRDAGGSPIFLLTGWAFESDPGSIRIIGRDAKGRPGLLFADETFAVVDIRAGTGGSQIIGRRTFSEQISPCLDTYDPFSVVAFAGQSMRTSATLSQQYNEEHYVWAGAAARTDVAVNHCGSRLRIVRAP